MAALALLPTLLPVLTPVISSLIHKVENSFGPKSGPLKFDTVLQCSKIFLQALSKSGHVNNLTDETLTVLIESLLSQSKTPPTGSNLETLSKSPAAPMALAGDLYDVTGILQLKTHKT